MANGEKGEKPLSLDDIIQNLQTEEGKAKAISLAVKKGATNDPKYTSQTFNATDLNASFEHITAAEKAFLEKNYDEAIKSYEKAGCYGAAAELAFKMGYADKGKAYKALQKISEMENGKAKVSDG